MEFLAAIFSDLNPESPSSFLYHWPKASSMLCAALLLTLVLEEFSEAPSVKRFFAERSKRRQTNS